MTVKNVTSRSIQDPSPTKDERKKEQRKREKKRVDDTVPGISDMAEDQPQHTTDNLPKIKKRKKERWSEERKEAAKKERAAGQSSLADQPPGKKKSKKKNKEEKEKRSVEVVQVVPLKPEERVSGPSNATEAEEIRNTLGFINGGTVEQAPGESNGAKAFSFQFTNIQGDREGKKSEIDDENVENKLEPASPAGMAGDADDEDIFIPRRVYVGGMPYAYSESDVRGFWEYCGPIESLDLLTFPDTGRFRGIAFITFATEEGYEAALACDGEACEGQTVKVQKCKRPNKDKKTAAPVVPSIKYTAQEGRAAVKGNPDNPAPKTAGYDVAYVGNIAWEADEAAIRAIFEPYGVTKVRLHTDKDTGRPKGYAHVHFKDEACLDKAITLNGTMLFGRRIRVGYAQPKKNS